MRKSALKGIVNWQTKRQSCCTKSQLLADDHHFKKEELESVGELSNVCSQIVSKSLYLVRMGGLDLLWSVSKLEDSKSTSG